MSSIFIQLAAYHDYELPKTIASAIETSSGKHQINFGVSACHYRINDIDMPKLPNIKKIISEAPNNLGLGVGRMLAHGFYDGEEYYFQFDSHTRFDRGWDDYLISEIIRFQSLGIKKPLLTMYPKGYSYSSSGTHFDSSSHTTHIVFSENRKQFMDILIPTQRADANPEGNIFSKSVSGGFIFTIGEFIKPNPRIAFYGEEIFIAARAFTNGFDMVIPSKAVMYHLYFNHSDRDNNFRRLVWEDFPEKFDMMDSISKLEIRKTFTEKTIGHLNLGDERPLSEYEIYSGLNFSTGEISECEY